MSDYPKYYGFGYVEQNIDTYWLKSTFTEKTCLFVARNEYEEKRVKNAYRETKQSAESLSNLKQIPEGSLSKDAKDYLMFYAKAYDEGKKISGGKITLDGVNVDCPFNYTNGSLKENIEKFNSDIEKGDFDHVTHENAEDKIKELSSNSSPEVKYELRQLLLNKKEEYGNEIAMAKQRAKNIENRRAKFLKNNKDDITHNADTYNKYSDMCYAAARAEHALLEAQMKEDMCRISLHELDLKPESENEMPKETVNEVNQAREKYEHKWAKAKTAAQNISREKAGLRSALIEYQKAVTTNLNNTENLIAEQEKKLNDRSRGFFQSIRENPQIKKNIAELEDIYKNLKEVQEKVGYINDIKDHEYTGFEEDSPFHAFDIVSEKEQNGTRVQETMRPRYWHDNAKTWEKQAEDLAIAHTPIIPAAYVMYTLDKNSDQPASHWAISKVTSLEEYETLKDTSAICHDITDNLSSQAKDYIDKNGGFLSKDRDDRNITQSDVIKQIETEACINAEGNIQKENIQKEEPVSAVEISGDVRKDIENLRAATIKAQLVKKIIEVRDIAKAHDKREEKEQTKEEPKTLENTIKKTYKEMGIKDGISSISSKRKEKDKNKKDRVDPNDD